MRPESSRSVMATVLAMALRLYPRRFRTRYGPEILAASAALHSDRRHRHGVHAATLAFLGTLTDLAIGGLIERARDLTSDHSRTESMNPVDRASAMTRLLHDVRFGLRTLGKQPLFTTVIVLTIGLGVGANSAMFSIVHGVLIRALPYEQPEQLVRVYQSDRFNGTMREGVSGPDYFDYLERQSTFQNMAAFFAFSPTLSDGRTDPTRIIASRVTHTFFSTLGRGPVIGRGFVSDEDEPGGRAVAVISHALWSSRFGQDSTVVGRVIRLDEVPYEVVGVMPAGFSFAQRVDVWLPLQYGPTTASRGMHNLGVVARLDDDVTIDQARRDMAAIMRALEEEYPDDNVGRGATVDPIEFSVVGGVRPALLLLMGAVGMVLVIACANVANLLFTRSAHRQREIAMRAALGASRTRLIQQLLTESVVLAAMGGLVGVLLALAGVRLLHMLEPSGLPRLDQIGLSPVVLIFTFAIAGATGIGFGLFPALRSAAPRLTAALADGGKATGGRRMSRVRATLAVAQVSVAFVLVVGAGLLLKSMWQLTRVEPGYDHENLVRLTVNLPQTRYPSDFRSWPEAPEVQQFYTEVLERITDLPTVSAAALAVNHPSNPGWTSRITIEGGPTSVEEGVEEERIRPISHGYFRTIGTPVLQGREFDSFDRGIGPPIAIVNQAFVEKYFRDDDPLHKRIQFWSTAREIVGVVADVRFMGLAQPSRPAVYAPMSQLPFSGFDIIVRSTGATDRTVAAVREQVGQIDRELAVFNVSSFDDILATSLSTQRFNMIMMALFAALALALATVGIYGVISYGVARRAHEFGIRMSLGADRGALHRMVLGQGFRLVAAGVIVGLLAAFASTRLLSGMLFNVKALDPATLAGVAVFMVAVAMLASFVPARRASHMDPIATLKHE